MSEPYRVGGSAHLAGAFTNDEGDPTDPSTLDLVLRFPDDTVLTVGLIELDHDGEGQFAYDLPLTMAGRHYWEWQPDGDVAGVDAGSFYVFRSPVTEAAG